MSWNLPTSVEIDGKEYKITNNCDYRMVLDVITALNDNELTDNQKLQCALYIFYEDLSYCKDSELATKEMLKIINYGQEEDEQEETSSKPALMDWKHDFANITPPISRILGYDVRCADKYTHWYTFLGGYMEIGECTFSNIISIRSKRAKGKPLEKWEQEFYKENKKMIDLPHNLTEEERAWLDSDC